MCKTIRLYIKNPQNCDSKQAIAETLLFVVLLWALSRQILSTSQKANVHIYVYVTLKDYEGKPHPTHTTSTRLNIKGNYNLSLQTLFSNERVSAGCHTQILMRFWM